ncbi:MAG TPA: hemolysin family protein, partial [bacterium]|nr:hemolysin family protein [bacterium]
LKFIIPTLPILILYQVKNYYPIFSKEKLLFFITGIFLVLLTELIIIVFEIIAKNKTAAKSKQTLLKYMFVLQIINFLMSIVVTFIFNFIKKICNMFGIATFEKSLLVTEEDIKALVEVGKDEGLLKEHEFQIFDRLLKFDDLKVKDVMIPIIDTDCINSSWSKEEVLNFIIQTKHSRIPVYKDNRDNIIGILYVKDLLDYLIKGENWEVEKIVREVQYVPEMKMLSQLLKQFQKDKIHINIVVDEYGTISGLITLEDIIEKLVGDIEDEYDIYEESRIKKIGQNAYIIDARINLNDLYEETGIRFDGQKFESLGGFLISLYGDIPPNGEKIVYNNYIFEVLNADKRRIINVKLTFF